MNVFLLSIFLFVAFSFLPVNRAQAAGGQEFANFTSELGVGTYENQARPLVLPEIDDDLSGFEGAIAANSTAAWVGEGGWVSSPDIALLDADHSILHIKSSTKGLGLSMGMMLSADGIKKNTKIIG